MSTQKEPIKITVELTPVNIEELIEMVAMSRGKTRSEYLKELGLSPTQFKIQLRKAAYAIMLVCSQNGVTGKQTLDLLDAQAKLPKVVAPARKPRKQ